MDLLPYIISGLTTLGEIAFVIVGGLLLGAAGILAPALITGFFVEMFKTPPPKNFLD